MSERAQTPIGLDDMDYPERYDATVKRGRCLECGEKVAPKYAGNIRIVPVWCASCDFEIVAKGATVSGAVN